MVARTLEEPLAKGLISPFPIWPGTTIDAYAIARLLQDNGSLSARLHKEIGDGLLHAYVAMDGERVVGAVLYRPGGEITDVAVDGDYRRRGIGTDLVHKAMLSLRKGGQRRAWATGSLDGFSLALGFEVVDD